MAGFEFTKYVTYEDTGSIIAIRGLNCKNGSLDLRDVKYIDNSDFSKLSRSKLYVGDILYTYVGTVGEVAVVDKNDKYYLAPNVSRIRLSKDYNSDFMKQLLGSKKFYYKIVFPLIATSSQPALSMENLRRFKLKVPSIKEQKKIASLFKAIDERIATQNKIIDKLQSLIKGIGKQLFMDNQNWRTVKIGELLRIGNGKDYKHLCIGKIPVYGTGGQMLLVNDYLYDGESVCIGRKGTIDTPMFLKGKFWTVDTLFYTYDFKDVLPKFCYYLFLQINWKLYNEGTGVPSLSKSTIENIKVKIPSLEQQQKICSILDCYEHKTNNEEQILELYHSEKQYLLRQMFI